ncbi:class I SAM-dependent methyltransferase [Alcanivorax marinus]|uniref:Class I SAM-dependent methyltransferase n=1 Tax=Alloalcanivorax marinus TaxID=1177169 RepID=A0A9Q3UPK4_9GAMM|nr:class I SAM-dependent methyltransferase [Alloalcanivorax marinus]MCC4309172.1 class I SAM-dependent methyltransferase [Alloalcanivorax marinus]MCU5788402.1 hypothetical protein [Alloalcanivorax marinus]
MINQAAVFDGFDAALVERAFPVLCRGDRVLDVPCGDGRISAWMAEQGWQVCALDKARAAFHTRSVLDAKALHGDVRLGEALSLPWPDRHFQGVLCSRLPDDEGLRRGWLRELARVTDHALLVPYFAAPTMADLGRQLMPWSRVEGQMEVAGDGAPLPRLASTLGREGFELDRDFPQRRFLPCVHLARFVRRSPAADAAPARLSSH